MHFQQDQFELHDGESVHLECTYLPKSDPQVQIEWSFNGEPLPYSSRIKAVADFGVVSLDISNVDSKDSGTYTCKAFSP